MPTAPTKRHAAKPISTPRESRVRSGRPLQLVERVGGDTDRQRKRAERGDQAAGVNLRRGRGAKGDVAQMPGRVGRVQQRDEVAPAA